MSRHLVNHLRDRNGPELFSGARDEMADPFGELNEQVIILGSEDICLDTPAAPLLDWSTFEKREIALQLKDTEGLAEGKVTVKASTLQRIHPELLPFPLGAEYLFPISLRTVVLQVQDYLRRSSAEKTNPVGSEFDTPISQVAREDEGFFKLAKGAEPTKTATGEASRTEPKIAGPILTPADRPASATRRKKVDRESSDSKVPGRSTVISPNPVDPWLPESEMGQVERDNRRDEATVKQSLSGIGRERLREIFMTEDQLGASEVADLLAAFPKVNSALLLLGDGTVLGGRLPENYHLETALLAPVIMQSIREFNRNLRSTETSAFTLLGDRPVTLFSEGNVYILISHEGRGLLPGMRERIGEIARALDAVCG
jgi:hypothetical protein